MCIRDNQSSLLPDLRQELAVIVEHQSTGVDDLELPIAPVAVLVSAITRHAWLIVNDGLPAATQPVHQGRLTDIRASDDCDDRTRQGSALANLSPYIEAIKPLENRNSYGARPMSLNLDN